MSSVWKFIGLGVLLATILITRTDLFFAKLQQALDINCSGEQDFVVATRRANGMVQVARSFTENPWADSELSVLQVGAPTINIPRGAGQQSPPFYKQNVPCQNWVTPIV